MKTANGLCCLTANEEGIYSVKVTANGEEDQSNPIDIVKMKFQSST